MASSRDLPDVAVRSAGTNANAGSVASDGSLLVALEEGLDLSGHRAQELTAELVHWSDLILVMGPHHLDRAETLGGEGKTFLLTAYASRGENSAPVPDPFGGDLPIYRETYHELMRQIGNMFDRVTSERP